MCQCVLHLKSFFQHSHPMVLYSLFPDCEYIHKKFSSNFKHSLVYYGLRKGYTPLYSTKNLQGEPNN